jgi:hypothetical protein
MTGSLLRLRDRLGARSSWFHRIRALTALGAPDTAQAETSYLHLSELAIENASPLAGDSAVVIAAVVSEGEAGRSIGLFAVEELARSTSAASPVSVRTTDLVLGRIPFDPGEQVLALAAYQVPLVGLAPAVIEEIRGLIAAIDHAGDGPGSLAVCAAICDRIEVLAGLPGFTELLAGAGRITTDERGWAYLVAGGDAMPPDDAILFATGGRLCDNVQLGPRWRFMLVELGGASAGGFARALDQLRRQHRAALGTTPGDADADDTESYWERDRRLRTTRDLAVRYGESAFRDWKSTAELTLALGSSFVELVRSIEAGVARARDGLYSDLGFTMPVIELTTTELEGASYELRIWNTMIASGEARNDRAFVNSNVAVLRRLGIDGEPAVNPANGNAAAWIARDDVPAAQAARLTTLDAADYVILHLSAVVRKNCASFFTLDMAAEVVNRASPELYRQVRKSPGGIAKLTTVLRLLLGEEVAIRAMRAICEEYLAIASAAEPSDHIAEALRNGTTLRPYLQKKFPATRSLLELGPAFAEALAANLVRETNDRVLALDRMLCDRMRAAVRAAIQQLVPGIAYPVLVVDDWRLRPHLRRLVELEFPHLAVLARRELADPAAHPRAALIELDEAAR